MVSTLSDYAKFAQMMLNKGTYQGVRILGRKTVEWMTQNHLNEKQLVSFDWGSIKRLWLWQSDALYDPYRTFRKHWI